jgi:hypothetical protein
MRALRRFTLALRRVFAAVFTQHLSLHRADDGVRVVLRDKPMLPAKAQPPSRAELAARKESQDFALLRMQLADLLNDLPETRSALRHLVFVEQALARKGLRALDKLPLDVVRRALDQLEGLVVNWSPAGLAMLRSRMAVAIIRRDQLGESGEVESQAHMAVSVLDSMPNTDLQDGLDVNTDDDEALAAAYAALGNLAPVLPKLHVELDGPAGRAGSAEPVTTESGAAIRVHVLNT